jgi:hypothetical protein
MMDSSPKAFDIASWRALTTKEVIDFMKTLTETGLAEIEEKRRSKRTKKSRKTKQGGILIVRTHLTPLDVYCYLKARFGEPNGFQNFLRKDDSHNFIHWEYQIESHGINIHIMGSNRQLHFWVGETLTDEQWKGLILTIKGDYKRVGVDKIRVLRGLEKWAVFPNKYVQIAEVCGELYGDIILTSGDLQMW